MKDLTTEVKKVALGTGIDFVGIAPVERLKNAPEDLQPKNFLGNTKSLVSFGVKISKGVIEANKKAYSGSRPAIYAYLMHGYIVLNSWLNDTAFHIARFLENEGYTATPLPSSRPFDSLKLQGVISHRHVAVAAGLGEFGWNALLLTTDYGPRVRLGTVLSDAELEPDPMYSGEKLCEKDKCNRLCVKMCPMSAISPEQAERLEMDGKTFEYAKVDCWKCLIGAAGFVQKTLGRKNIEIPEIPTPNDYLNACEQLSPWQRMERAEEGSFCGRCLVCCPAGNRRK